MPPPDPHINREVERIRDRLHTHGNRIQELVATVAALDRTLTAIHLSLKEDLIEIKKETHETNGRVSDHDREISKMKGIGLAAIAGTPFVIFALSRLIGVS